MAETYHLTETLIPDETQEALLLELWNQEYPAKLCHKDIETFHQYLCDLDHPLHVLLSDPDDQIQGWAFSFDRDGERWFAILVSAKAQNQGYGSRLLDIIKSRHYRLSGWVIDHDMDSKADGTPYKSPLAFYLKNGFEVLGDTRLELEIISAVKIIWSRSQ